MPLRIVFMGTSDFAVPTLRAVAGAGHEIAAVYTQPPRPGGRRGLQPVPSPVERAARELGVDVRTPVTLRNEAEQGAFRALGADAAVVSIDDATPSELRAAYAAADALVMMSAHEGFCVPLVEAMALGTPIVAFGSSALAWTIGDAGIVWNEPDPHLVAMSVMRIHTDLMLREMLRELGRARYRDAFSPAALAGNLEAAFARFAA